MKEALRERAELVQVLVGVLVTALAAADMVGKPARTVGVLTVGAGMFGAGIGLGQAIARRRLGRGRRGAEG